MQMEQLLTTGQDREHKEAEIASIFGEKVAAALCRMTGERPAG
jgi:hypothetical protein